MGTKLRAHLKPSIQYWCYGLKGVMGALNWGSLMPRGDRLSNSYASRRLLFFSLDSRRPISKKNISPEPKITSKICDRNYSIVEPDCKDCHIREAHVSSNIMRPWFRIPFVIIFFFTQLQEVLGRLRGIGIFGGGTYPKIDVKKEV